MRANLSYKDGEYMTNLKWRFPILDDGEEQGINDSGIATFKGSELYNNLAREICQNSLDASALDDKPVKVKFQSHSLKISDYPALSGLKPVIEECNNYWKERMEPKLKAFLNEASSRLSAEYIDALAISDYNTKGLSGAKKSSKEKSVWKALTSSNGVTQKEKGSGGSYGIGKNAPFACSALRTIFYNSYAVDDEIKAFQGVAKLVTHTHDGEDTQGVGFFQNERSPIYGEDACKLRDFFNREEYGTDVIIVGFKKTESLAEDIEKAIISNFFYDINDGKLVVEIDGNTIDKQTLSRRIDYYAAKESHSNDKDRKIATTKEFYTTIVEPDEILYESIEEKDDVTLYIKKDNKYSKSIVEMRSIGMVVRERNKPSIFTRFSAVMVVTGSKLNEILKTIEPPQHNKWDAELIENDEKAKTTANEVRSRLIRWTNEQISEFCKTESPGEIDLDGVSAYLPFDEDDESLGGDESTDLTLDSNNVPGQIEIKRRKSSKTTLTAKKVTGRKNDDYEPHNGTHGGSRGGAGGVEDPNGTDTVTATVPGDKTVNVPKILLQRIMKTPVKSAYRTIIVLDEDCANLHLTVKAIGDDGNKESIMILKYKMGRDTYSANTKSIILHDIKAKEQYEVFVYLEHSEKMLLELLLY